MKRVTGALGSVAEEEVDTLFFLFSFHFLVME